MKHTIKAAIAATALVLTLVSPASAASVCSSSGKCVQVGSEAQAALQCVVTYLESHGVRITALGGNRRGHCSTRHMHSCHKALDVNQTARDVGGPPRALSSAAASACGVVSGSWWAGNPDNGHFQMGGYAGTHGDTVTASAHVHHRSTRHHRVAYNVPVHSDGWAHAH